MLAIATGAFGLYRLGEPYRTAVAAYLADTKATVQKSVEASASSFFGSPDAFSVACLERGGTVVQVRSPQGSMVRRCAVKFDDDLQR
jgi:putative hemolysin